MRGNDTIHCFSPTHWLNYLTFSSMCIACANVNLYLEAPATFVSYKEKTTGRVPFLRMGPTVSMCSLRFLSSEYILLLCGQFCIYSTHTHSVLQKHVSSLLRFKMNMLAPLCRHWFLRHKALRRSGGEPHRSPRWTWRRWRESDRWAKRRSLPCQWCCP